MSLNLSRMSGMGRPDLQQSLPARLFELHIPHISTKKAVPMKWYRALKLEEIFAMSYFGILLLAAASDWSLRREASRIRAEAKNHVLVRVEGMCCQFIASAVSRELTELPGVVRVIPEFQSKMVRVQLHRKQPASVKTIWDAIERTPARPVRLVLNCDAFSERPLE